MTQPPKGLLIDLDGTLLPGNDRPTTAVVEPPENLVTRQIAAEVLGCSKDALRKRIKRGTVQVRDGLVVLPA